MKIQSAAGECVFACTAAMCAFSPVLSVIMDAHTETTPLILTIASTTVLRYVCEYLKLLVSPNQILSHIGLPQPLPSHELLDFLTVVEKQYIERVSPTELVSLLHTANYLGINGLMELCCARMASACIRQDTFNSLMP
jgi:hypothetical protein